MRFYYNGAGFTVSFSERDTADFGSRYPASQVSGKGFVEFNSRGDIEGCGGSVVEACGFAWAAFMEDCKKYGLPRYTRKHKLEENQKYSPEIQKRPAGSD